LLSAICELSNGLNIIFPVHPRTRQRLNGFEQYIASNGGLRFLDPMPYLEFLALQQNASVVITDSGGIQEETTFLGVPCLTLRENTERPITISLGTNLLIGRDVDRLQNEVRSILNCGAEKKVCSVPLWDGHAAERIASVIARDFALPGRATA